ncbi:MULTISPECIES: inositol monophosphatase family protein [Glutamicibacter]|jgi:histidinol-phosphatase|uniref:Histidinol-phosphatase n=5 Tax=Glutamicibacter arilaitensis TaxID=256701 RepID=A0A4Y8U1J0_9MICC|nr:MULTISPECIES: inositol monophosphatase family protein [Glutamicibacter]TFH57609.1 histidinol phosphatase [Glutamicibacter arilaitensis]CBT75438.1 putative histidinol-phosphatase [Glutamicibacter arilaitensis Re117]HCH47326.1 histidinol phosphatase [Glutamicibacter sp.]
MAEYTLQQDLDFALALADKVDAFTLARYGANDLVVESKPDMTPVSDADRGAEQLILAELAAHRPDDSVLGEEFGVHGSGSRRWVIDPIDGTKNFVRRVPVWATLIALLIDDEPVLGVVSAPAMVRRWHAATDLGAFVTEPGAAVGTTATRPLQVSSVASLADSSLGYASLNGWKDAGKLDGFLELLDTAWRTRGYGDFLSYALLAEGALDAAFEPELELYDMAALVPVVREAGGRFTSVAGVEGCHGGNALATNGKLHEAILPYLNRS